MKELLILRGIFAVLNMVLGTWDHNTGNCLHRGPLQNFLLRSLKHGLPGLISAVLALACTPRTPENGSCPRPVYHTIPPVSLSLSLSLSLCLSLSVSLSLFLSLSFSLSLSLSLSVSVSLTHYIYMCVYIYTHHT